MTRLQLTSAALAFSCATALPASAQTADPARGEGVFLNRCSECHAVTGEEIKIGPPLTGLFGRTAGTREGYTYSDAMRQSGIVWTAEVLAEYLVKPKLMVPNTKMNFNGLKRPGETEDLIAYLAIATAG